MSSKPEPLKRQGRTGALLTIAALLTAMLGACAGKTVSPAGSAAVQAPASAATPAAGTTVQDPAVTTRAAAPATPGELVRMLAYADRVRAMSAAELGQETARLNHPTLPAEQLQLALVLSQLRQTPELIRAQELLTRLIANLDPDAQVLHPLARLLAARYGEQRRLEDLLDKQNQQTREVQRRLDQTNERLEALKAIERSLTSRPAASSPASPVPAGRARPVAP